MRAVEREESDQPEEPVSAGKAPRDDEAERPEDKHHADVEGQAQAGPGGRQDRDVGAARGLHLKRVAQARHVAAVDIGEGIPFLERVEPLPPFKGEARVGDGGDDIMAAKAAQDAFKAHIVERGHRFGIIQRADEQAGEINGHEG